MIAGWLLGLVGGSVIGGFLGYAVAWRQIGRWIRRDAPQWYALLRKAGAAPQCLAVWDDLTCQLTGKHEEHYSDGYIWRDGQTYAFRPRARR